MRALVERAARGGMPADLAATLVALLRTEGHLCNVLTHISSGNWSAVETAIKAILEPRMSPKRLSHLAGNMLELLCDNRGVTGPIMRSFVFAAIARIAGKAEMKRLEAKIQRLRLRLSAAAAGQAPRRSLRRSRERRAVLRARLRPLPADTAAAHAAHGGQA